MANFAVRLVHGPCWDPSRPIREQDGWDEHATFMDELVDDLDAHMAAEERTFRSPLMLRIDELGRLVSR